MTNDHCVRIRNLFFDVELNCAAAHVHRAGNMSFVPFVFVADVNGHGLAAFQFRCGILRRNLRDVLLRFGNQLFQTRVLSHSANLTTDYTDGTDGFWSAAACRRFESADMSAHSKSNPIRVDSRYSRATPYSYRSASMGSRAAALRAG